jgi:hypothetical protein
MNGTIKRCFIAVFTSIIAASQVAAGSLQFESCSIFDPDQNQYVEAQWSGPCVNWKAEGTGQGKWLGPSKVFLGKKFPFQYDGDMKEGKFHGRGRWGKENIALIGNFTQGNLPANGNLLAQLLPTEALINGQITMDEAYTSTIYPIMEMECVKGKCTNGPFLNKIKQQQAAQNLFGLAVGTYIAKEGFKYLLQAFLANSDNNSSPNSQQVVIPPFTSCNELQQNCENICQGKSDNSPVFSLSIRGDKGKCEDKCIGAVVACEHQRDGDNSSIFDDISIRSHFCSAICSGADNSYSCEDKCKSNYDFWGW